MKQITKLIALFKALFKIIIFIYNKVILLLESLIDNKIIFFTFLIGVFYVLQSHLFSIDIYNNSCSLLLNEHKFFCKIPTNIFLFIPELLIYGFLFMSIKSFYGFYKINGKEFYLNILAHVLFLYIIFRIVTIQYIDFPILSLANKYYYIIGEYFYFLVVFLFIILLSYRKGDIEYLKNILGIKKITKPEMIKTINEPIEEEKDDNKLFQEKIIKSIKDNLPKILNKILSGNSFKRITFNEEGILKNNLFKIKNVLFEDSSSVFVELYLHNDLIDSINTLSGNDWTLGINSSPSGRINSFLSAKWRSQDGKNGLIIKIKEKTIDMTGLYNYPFLLEKNPNLKLPLDFIVGKNKSGKDIVFNLATLPHLLVGGSTGGGKSVGMTNILVSLMKNKLDGNNINFIIVDPKRVEFGQYKNLDGFQVITDMDKAVYSLRWCVAEMERRYSLLEGLGYKNISEYNERGGDMGYLIVTVDEFGDLMSLGGDIKKEVEGSIIRLAQKSRACGIHLIIATQNPIADVITSNIKANLPSVLGFKTNDGVKSRTVIDETFLAEIKNKGESYLKSDSGLEHIKTFFLNKEELDSFIDFYKSQTIKRSIITPLFNVVEKDNIINNEDNPYIGLESFAKYIDKNSLEIDKNSKEYRLMRYLVENNGYKNRDTFISIGQDFGFNYRSCLSLISKFKEVGFIISDEKRKFNKLNLEINNENLLSFFTCINELN